MKIKKLATETENIERREQPGSIAQLVWDPGSIPSGDNWEYELFQVLTSFGFIL